VRGVAGHLTLRDPLNPDQYHVNPCKRGFGAVLPEDLLLVSSQGRVVEGTEELNPSVHAIHAALHAARPTCSQLRRLGELADEYRFWIAEDDPYHQWSLDPDGMRLPSIAATFANAVRIGTLSKILFPAARVGFLRMPDPPSAYLRRLRQAADLGGSQLLQRLVCAVIRNDPTLAARIDRARRCYRARRDALAEALSQHAGDFVTFDLPAGGIFLWATLRGGVDAHALLGECIRHGLSFVPGRSFYADAPETDRLRLCYSCLPETDAQEAAHRFRHACVALRAEMAP
jgi:2-aminoadipate transaminase